MKYFKTTCLSLASISVGLFIAINGPTLPTLAYNLRVSIESISCVVTARGFGYLLGSIVVRSLMSIYCCLVLCFFSSIGSLVVPFVNYVSLLAAALSTAGFAMGFLDTVVYVLCLQIWGDKSGPRLQTLNFFYAVGTFVAPFIAIDFIMDTNVDITFSKNRTSLSDISVNATVQDSFPINSENFSVYPHPKHAAVKYAFVISSVFALLISLFSFSCIL